uniref:Uncharacterized protein n=1 Tax=Anguilla anguilla TaxID=7936 RepID=A0A0E9QDE1_ANGAN
MQPNIKQNQSHIECKQTCSKIKIMHDSHVYRMSVTPVFQNINTDKCLKNK